jgi:hypothetical protein
MRTGAEGMADTSCTEKRLWALYLDAIFKAEPGTPDHQSLHSFAAS